MIYQCKSKENIYLQENTCIKLIGTIYYISEIIYYEEYEGYYSKVFIDFLKSTLSHYKTRKIVMILYNYKMY